MGFGPRWLLLLILLHVVQAATAYAQEPTAYRGRPLQSVLDELRARGAPLAYSSNLVPRRLVVEQEPHSTELEDLAREILTPHGLALDVLNGVWLVVRGPAAPVPAPTPGGLAVAAVRAATTEPVADAIAQLDPPAGPSAALVAGRASFATVAPGRHTLVVRAPGYLAERRGVDVAAGTIAEVAMELSDARPQLEEVTVTASRYDLHSEVRPSANYFSREQIETLGELGDDALRVAHRLPGIASNEISSRSHVRGGAVDEMAVIFDGVELFEPFHLRDFQSVFSAIDQQIVSGIEFYSGGFPVAYGGALSGLTVIDRLEPTEPRRYQLGLSLLYTSLLSSGTFGDGRAQWVVSARRSNIDQLLEDELGEPSYGDAFVHVGVALGEKHKLAVNDITYDDDITLGSTRSDEQGRSETDNNEWWLKVDSDWSPSLSSRSVLYSWRFIAERRGAVLEPDEMIGFADDRRRLDALGVKQDWTWDASERQLVTWGFEAERLDGRYAYVSAVDLRGVLATLEQDPRRSASHALAPEGESYGVYASDRVRLTDRAIADIGVRWDEQTYLPPGADRQFSPRGSVLYRLGTRSDLRFSYGRFFQTENLLALQIEDGVLDFAPAQNAAHSILGFEHRFGGDLALRVEMFRKWTRDARPRYENLFDPLAVLPELRPGRVRIVPERAEARGFEASLTVARPVSWWMGYSYARADDVLGAERVARSWDQRHALSGGLSWNAGPWTLSGVATLHSGWPVTSLALEPSNAANAVDGVVAVPGPRNADRLRPMRRIDFRASKVFGAPVGSLRFFAEITNATNRANICCVRYEAVTGASGQPALDREEQRSLPLTGNVGVLWEF